MKSSTKNSIAAARLLPTLLCVVGLTIGCGPEKPKPQTARDLLGGGAAELAPKPKRDLSGAAKKDFNAAMKRYRGAFSRGTFDKSSCSSVAGAFGDVYSSHSKLVEAKFNEGAVWEKCGDPAKAEQIYQAVISKHPNHGPSLNNLGQIFHNRGQSGAAQSYFQKAAAAKNSEGYSNLAKYQRERALRGDSEALREAVNNIHRALAVDSYNVEAYALLATILYDHARTKSQLDMARLICVQATKINAELPAIYNVLGLILLKQGRVTPALAEFKKAVQRNPNFVEALMNIGMVTLSFRDYSTAEASFRKVLGLKPGKEVKYAATVGLGVALRGKRKFSAAMAQYKTASNLDPANADIAYNMGILVQDYTFDASDPAKGIATLQTAVQHLNRYVGGAKNRRQVKDAQRRLKNIREMIPMLKQQQKMMQNMGKK